MSWTTELEGLKHSIKLHVQCAGGVTLQLSQVGLKMVDAFEMLRDNGNPAADLNVLASCLIKSLVDSAEQRLTMLGIEEAGDIAMAMASEKLKLPKNAFHHKQFYLRMLSQAHKDLARFTGNTYPQVTNLDGDVL